MARQKVYLGTELKLNINIEPIDEMTMDDYNFNVELICGLLKKTSKVISKDKAKRIDQDNYMVCFNTDDLGVGKLRCKVTAYLPDGDFEDSLRTEITETDTEIEIIKTS